MDDFGFEIRIIGTYIRCDCFGTASREGLLGLIDTIQSQTAQGPNFILVDISKLSGNLDTLSRYTLGIAVADKLSGRRVAVVGEKEKINKVGENTAVNRGANMFVTHDPEDALNWLLKVDPPARKGRVTKVPERAP